MVSDIVTSIATAATTTTTTTTTAMTTIPPPVKVQVYTESLCIDCKNFILNHLLPTYIGLSSNIIDLEIIPYGNSELIIEQQDVKCQHGIAECDANTWEQCVVHNYKEYPFEYLNYITCLEYSLPMGHNDNIFNENIFEICSNNNNSNNNIINFNTIKSCHDNPILRWQLQQDFANKTPIEHDHVPWVVINGKYMDEEKNDFFEVICKEYITSGGSHPACN